MVNIEPKSVYVKYHLHSANIGCIMCADIGTTSLSVQGRLYTWYRGISRKNEEKKHARSFNFTFHYRYIDDVLSLNNSKFADFVGASILLSLNKMDTADTTGPVSYLDLYLEIEWGPVNEKSCTKKEIISMLTLWTFHLYVESCCSYHYFLVIILPCRYIYLLTP